MLKILGAEPQREYDDRKYLSLPKTRKKCNIEKT